jgi:hypothetical protein
MNSPVIYAPHSSSHQESMYALASISLLAAQIKNGVDPFLVKDRKIGTCSCFWQCWVTKKRRLSKTLVVQKGVLLVGHAPVFVQCRCTKKETVNRSWSWRREGSPAWMACSTCSRQLQPACIFLTSIISSCETSINLMAARGWNRGGDGRWV